VSLFFYQTRLPDYAVIFCIAVIDFSNNYATGEHGMKSLQKITTLSSLAMLSMAVISSVQASHVVSGPGVICYDFSNMVPGTQYNVGDVFTTPDLRTEIHPLRTLDGTPIINAAQHANIAQSQVSGVISPEYHGYFVNTRMLPTVPQTSISMHVGQNPGGNNAYIYSNLAINGEFVQLANGLASANGLVLGNDTDGQVLVSTTLVNPAPGQPAQWINGTIELTALTGSIRAFTIGTVQYTFDDVCLTQ
jgi:hypothetical protein